ncbi:MAG: SBBP repeat-containing protein [Bacteroidia bacterium]
MKRVQLLILLFILSLKGYSQITPLWTNTYQGTGDNSDRYNAIAKDGAGNIYLAGYTFQTGQDKNYLLVKINQSGVVLWSRVYNNSTANGSDKVFFVGVDGLNNVYISGTTDGGSINQNDILTQKYDASGTMQWTATYNNVLANQNEEPLGMSVDNSGNVYITGLSDKDSTAFTNDDIITLKYNTAGTLLWSARINGVGNGTDRGSSITSDNAGNCFITGRTFTNNASADDVITVKYNSSGGETWRNVYNRNGNNDRGEAIAIDDSGNVFTTGRSSNGNSYDFVLIKYNAAGLPQFTSFYSTTQDEYPSRIALDANRNILVAGQRDVDPSGGTNNYDYQLVKFNPSGVQQWAQSFGNAANNAEDPNGLLTDASGNIYITGKSDVSTTAGVVANNYLTVKYDASGVLQWSAYFNGTAVNSDDIAEGMVLDGAGNIYVAGGAQNLNTQKDGMVIKYNVSTGAVTLSQVYNGTGEYTDKIQGITTDTLNNVYVTGYVYNSERRKDLFTRKINAAGTVLWTSVYDFVQSDDEGKAIAVDDSGYVYVTGQSIGSGTSDDFITIKYDAAGNQLWASRYNFANEADVAVSIAVNIAGLVFVTGYSDANPSSFVTDYDYATIKYSATGNEMAVTRYSGAVNKPDRPVKLIISGSSVYVTGRSSNASNYDIVTIKYPFSLTQSWVATYAGTGNGDDVPADLTVENGNAYVTGYSFNGVSDDIVTLKYTSAGLQSWAATYNGALNGSDRPGAMTINANGVYVTGRTTVGLGADSADFITVKYNKTSGAQVWSNIYNGPGAGYDKGTAIVTNVVGSIIASGDITNSGTTTDMSTILYDDNGNRKWIANYNGAGNGDDAVRANLLDKTGFLYVAGYVTGAGSAGFDATTLKYCPQPGASAGADVAVCKGSGTTLTASGGNSYLWTPAAGLSSSAISNPVASPVATTTYTVTVSNTQGCSATATIKVTVNSVPSATIIPSGTDTICSGDSLLLSANSGAGLTYQWKKGTTVIAGAAGISYYAKTAASYKVLVTNSGGCTKLSVTAKIVYGNPTATITASGPTSFCAGDSVIFTANSGAGFTYQWKKGTTNIAGATGISYTAKTAGIYKVVVASSNGCTKLSTGKTVTVNCRTVNNAISDLEYAVVNPNPFSNSFQLNLKSESDEKIRVVIYNVIGSKVYESELFDNNDEKSFGQDLNPGIYFAEVIQGDHHQMLRVVKAR